MAGAGGSAVARERKRPRFLLEFLTSGLSVSAANVVTIPADVVKVRMQLQKASFGAEAAAPGSVRVLVLYNASSASTL
jgi:hypothetical protein